MLAVSSPPPLRSTRSDESQGELMENNFSMGTTDEEYFGELSEGNLLESINFDDLFDEDILPDLEMDPEMLAEFSSSISTGGAGAGEEYSEMNSSSVSAANNNIVVTCTKKVEEEEERAASSDSGNSSRGEEIIMSKRDESVVVHVNPSPNKEGTTKKGRKSSSTQSKNNPQGKRKVKVDWTPELHRRFVQAVEQLGVDKAVPSRILEIMGIDCLTRHNIASHLQKYRSHRKHLLAREAEAASWSQRRLLYGASTRGGGGGKRDVINPWLAVLPPTMGFPPPPPPMTPPPPPMHHFRVPLHVWGHHTMDQSFIHMWPKHLPYSPPQPAWAPPTPPPPDPSYWHQRAPNAPITPGTPCFLTTARFGSPTVPGIPRPHAMYQVDPGSIGVPSGQPSPSPLLDFHPSKESIDAAISDVLSKPWLPLPLGLKAPALDGVMGELQRQGVPKIPPSCA